jgi:hypothetical protein
MRSFLKESQMNIESLANKVQDIAERTSRGTELWILKSLQIDFDLAALGVSFLIFVAFAALFLRSGVFVVGYILSDTLLYTEAAYREAHGQWPGLNFLSGGAGALWWLPLALTYKLNGDLVASIPISFVAFASAVFILSAYIAWTRLNAVVGCLVICFCSILVMAPWEIGSAISPWGSTHTTAASGYNKLGFTLVLIASLLAVNPKSARQRTAARWDAVFALVCFGLAFYLKMPFGLGVAGMVCLWASMLTKDRLQVWKFMAGVAVLFAVVELAIPGLNAAYIREMAMYAQIQPALDLYAIVRVIFQTAPEILVVGVLPVVALATQGLCKWSEFIFFIALVAGSIVLLTVSTGGANLVAPLAVAVAALSVLVRQSKTLPNRAPLWAAVVAFAFGFWTYFYPAANAIVRHNWYAGRSAPIENMPRSYSSLRVPSEIDLKPMIAAFNNRLGGADAYAAARSKVPLSTINALFVNEYAFTLTDLPNAQLLCGDAKERTAILDTANVSSSLLGLQPVGGYTWAQFMRGYSESVHWPSDKMFLDVECLFDPKLPDNPAARDGLWLVYGAMIRDSFREVGETEFWRVFVRNSKR